MPLEIIPTVVQTVTATSSASANTTDFIGPLIGIVVLLFFLFLIGGFIFWIWSIIDVAKNENFTDNNMKVIWLILIVLVGPIVSLVYFFMRPKKQIVAVANTPNPPVNPTT